MEKTNPWMRLLTDCLSQLNEANCTFKFHNTKLIYIKEEDCRVKGFWDEAPDTPIIECTLYGPEERWMPIFTHEFCHFVQWREECKFWHDSQAVDADDMYKILHNKPIKEELMNYTLESLRELELDCEKRAVRLFKKYKVPLDIEDYIRRANSYVHFYNHIKTHRKWYTTKNIPYDDPKFISHFPPTFQRSYKTIPSDLAKLFEKKYPSAKMSRLL